MSLAVHSVHVAVHCVSLAVHSVHIAVRCVSLAIHSVHVAVYYISFAIHSAHVHMHMYIVQCCTEMVHHSTTAVTLWWSRWLMTRDDHC